MRSLLSCERGACGERGHDQNTGREAGGGSGRERHSQPPSSLQPPPSSFLPPASFPQPPLCSLLSPTFSLQPPSQPPSSLQTPTSQPSHLLSLPPSLLPQAPPPKHFWNISCGLPFCKSLHGFSKTLCRSLTRVAPHWSPRRRPGLPAFQGRRTHCTAPAPSWLVPEATSLGLRVQGQPLPLTSGWSPRTGACGVLAWKLETGQSGTWEKGTW